MLVMTIKPFTDGDPPFVCNFDLLQNGMQTDDIGLRPDPSNNASGFCGDVLTPMTVAIVPTFRMPAAFDMDGAMTLVYDGGSLGMQSINIPAYNPDAYGPPTPHPTRDYTGQWHNPNESGRGVSMYQFGNTLFALWFVYDGEGRALWYQLDPRWVENDVAAGNVIEWTGPAWGPTYSGDREHTVVGDFTLEFTSANDAEMTYDVAGVERVLRLEKIR